MKLLLFDGLNLSRRIFSAGCSDQTPPDDDLTEQLARRCAGSLDRALATHQPSHAAAAFAAPGATWRHRLCPAYKANHKPMPAALAQAMPRLRAGFRERGVRDLEAADCAADDVLASVAANVAARQGEVVILSTDRLPCQLLDRHIAVFDHFSRRRLDRAYVLDRFQVEPRQIPDLLGLAGDHGAAVPGVPGVGLKTAAMLLGQFGSLEGVLAHAGEIPGRAGRRIRAHREAAATAKALFTLRTDIVLGVNLQDLRLPGKA